MALGVNITLSSDPRVIEADCVLAKALGATWVRTSQEYTWDNEHWQPRLQQHADIAHAHGLLLWQTAQGMPSRFAKSGKTGHYVTTSQAGLDWWGVQCAVAAAIADACGLGNENNGYGSNDVHPEPQALADMCLSAVEHRDKDAPGRRLCTPEFCPAGGTRIGQDGKWDTYIEPLLFFQTMIEHAPTLLDASKLWIGWHGYCDVRYAISTPQVWNQAWRMRALNAYLVSIGHPGKTICSPEFGGATGPANWAQRVTPDRQAAAFDEYWAEFKSQVAAGVRHGPMILYYVRDYKPNPAYPDWPAYCGLVDINGRSKPIAARFKAAATA